MSKSRVIVYFSMISGGITTLMFYKRIINFPFSLLHSNTTNPLLSEGVVLLIGALLFTLGIWLSQSRLTE